MALLASSTPQAPPGSRPQRQASRLSPCVRARERFFISQCIDPVEHLIIFGPHRPEQGIGLGLGDGAAAFFRDDDLAVTLDEVPAVVLPGRGEHPLHTGLRRVRLAGEVEPGKEDKQNEVNFSHDHRRHGRRQGAAGFSLKIHAPSPVLNFPPPPPPPPPQKKKKKKKLSLRQRNFCRRGPATTGDARPESLHVLAGLFRTLSLIGTACKNNL